VDSGDAGTLDDDIALVFGTGSPKRAHLICDGSLERNKIVAVRVRKQASDNAGALVRPVVIVVISGR
jgi:hypothetical protein